MAQTSRTMEYRIVKIGSCWKIQRRWIAVFDWVAHSNNYWTRSAARLDLPRVKATW